MERSAGARLLGKMVCWLQADRTGEVLFLPEALVGAKKIKVRLNYTYVCCQ